MSPWPKCLIYHVCPASAVTCDDDQSEPSERQIVTAERERDVYNRTESERKKKKSHYVTVKE